MENKNTPSKHRQGWAARLKRQLREARDEANRYRQALNNALVYGQMKDTSSAGYYKMLGNQNAQIDQLISMVDNLTKTVMEQRELINKLKQHKINSCTDK
jgi:multidrug resistance efflux pump